MCAIMFRVCCSVEVVYFVCVGGSLSSEGTADNISKTAGLRSKLHPYQKPNNNKLAMPG